MKSHILSEEDVTSIFAESFIIPLASCARAGRTEGKPTRKALEYHLDLNEPLSSHYLVISFTDGVPAAEYMGGDRSVAVAVYNDVDV